MSIDRRLLVILGRHLPAIYDIIPRLHYSFSFRCEIGQYCRSCISQVGT